MLTLSELKDERDLVEVAVLTGQHENRWLRAN